MGAAPPPLATKPVRKCGHAHTQAFSCICELQSCWLNASPSSEERVQGQPFLYKWPKPGCRRVHSTHKTTHTHTHTHTHTQTHTHTALHVSARTRLSCTLALERNISKYLSSSLLVAIAWMQAQGRHLHPI